MKYKVYVNASIEIWDEVEADNDTEAYDKAYDLIGHRAYDCNIELEKDIIK